MKSPDHHIKSPKKSQYGKAPTLHNPKWLLIFNILLYLGSQMAYLSDTKIWKGVFFLHKKAFGMVICIIGNLYLSWPKLLNTF